MRNITLIEGIKGAGKSTWIISEYNRIKHQCREIDVKNPSDINTVIYILQDNSTKGFIILNSGSDTQDIIDGFEAIVADSQYANATIYTAIRPSNMNPRLHKWMMDALHITHSDKITTISLP